MFEIGEKVGPYRVVSKLGHGGMATVYQAYHANLDRHVALKVLHPALKQDDNFLARFRREARLIARLEHPNIVSIYDYDEYKGNPYLVMQFIEGQTLKVRLKEGPLSIVRITNIVTSVGAALDYAHQQGVLHRDIKPSNIMLTDRGKVMLTDFGLARMSQSGESTQSRDLMLGTPQYVSPEQARGDPDIDARTDIYSLGVVIYELVVGQVPFIADTPYAVIHDHIFTPLPLPCQVNPLVPKEIETFLIKILAKSRVDRYQTAGEMAHAFETAVEQAGADEVEAATRVEPIPQKVMREIIGKPDVTTKAATPTWIAETVPPPAAAISTPSDIRRRRRARNRREAVWALVGLILLVILMVSGGITLRNAVSEEFDRIYNQVEDEGSFLDDTVSWG